MTTNERTAIERQMTLRGIQWFPGRGDGAWSLRADGHTLWLKDSQGFGDPTEEFALLLRMACQSDSMLLEEFDTLYFQSGSEYDLGIKFLIRLLKRFTWDAVCIMFDCLEDCKPRTERAES